MTIGAWIMLVFAIVFIGGGLFWSLGKAKKSEEIEDM